MGLGMGMEYLLGKGHMVFPEDFFMSCIRWKHHTPFAQSDWLIRLEKEKEREVRFHLGVHFTCRRGAYSQFSRRRGHGFPVPWCRFPMGVCNCHTHRLRFGGMSIVITYLALSVVCVPRRWEGRYVSLA